MHFSENYSQNISDRDKKIMWHPFTQALVADLPMSIKKGEGAYLYDESGKKYLDLISSWWVNLHGHGHPVIAKAIYNQALNLEHVLFAGFTHEPAVKLCENLKNILPDNLSRFFFSDNGSTAVEVALKIAYQYWFQQGEKNRKLFLSFEGGYHGDTVGAMSMSQKSGFHDTFLDLCFKVHTISYPETWLDDNNIQQKEAKSLEELNNYLSQYGDQTAAFMMEPLVQGASGMRMCRPEFLRKVIDILRKYNILIIFDEVMTGFCRTGTYFALEQIERKPDMICLSKGLTGGFLPLALTVVTEKIYEQFLDEDIKKAFLHGHSYTANPLGCAAGIASLDLLISPTIQENIKIIQQTHKEQHKKIIAVKNNLGTYNSDMLFSHFRVSGTIAAMDLHIRNNAEYNSAEINSVENNIDDINKKLIIKLKKYMMTHGCIIRPLGNTVYILPPYCITKQELERVYELLMDFLAVDSFDLKKQLSFV